MKNKLDYKFKLNDFDGPLDLLLHLVKKKKIDVFDINLLELTNQYLDFINENINESLEVMSEYLVITAYLIELKSKLLLPKKSISDISDNYEAEEKMKLVASLLEYQEYKNMAHKMSLLEEEREKFLDKEHEDLPETKTVFNEVLNVSSLNEQKIINAVMKMVDRLKQERPIESVIKIKRISIEERTEEVKQYFKNISKTKIEFIDLFEQYDNAYIAITLLTVLELSKNSLLKITQDNNFKEIYLEWIGDKNG